MRSKGKDSAKMTQGGAKRSLGHKDSRGDTMKKGVSPTHKGKKPKGR